MAEEAELPFDQLQDDIKERVERDSGEPPPLGRLSHARYIRLLAGSTAVFAVLAAVASLASGSYANEALFKANQAVLAQTIASDTWAEYQADGLKRISYTNEATTLRQLGAPIQAVQDAVDNAQREGDKQPSLQRLAQKTEADARLLQVESIHQLEHHHRFSYSVTLFQVAIGLAALAALVNIQPVWWLSLLTGIGGMVLLLYGFWPIRDVAPPTQSPQGSATPSAVRSASVGTAHSVGQPTECA
jgi:hypothetical protein